MKTYIRMFGTTSGPRGSEVELSDKDAAPHIESGLIRLKDEDGSDDAQPQRKGRRKPAETGEAE